MMAKKVYHNGYVYTVDKDRSVASAVVTEGDRIVYAGDNLKAKAIGGADAELIDLEGRMMLPGLIDGHCHPIMAAHFLSGVVLDIDWTVEETLKAIHNAIQLDMEDRLGSIEPGKYADLVVLEKNLFEIPPEEIHKVKVCETIIGGETVYKAEQKGRI